MLLEELQSAHEEINDLRVDLSYAKTEQIKYLDRAYKLEKELAEKMGRLEIEIRDLRDSLAEKDKTIQDQANSINAYAMRFHDIKHIMNS